MADTVVYGIATWHSKQEHDYHWRCWQVAFLSLTISLARRDSYAVAQVKHDESHSESGPTIVPIPYPAPKVQVYQ